MQKSIRQDLSIRIGLAIFCISIVIGIVYYSFSIYYHENEFKKTIANQTKQLSDTFTVQLWLFDLNTTKKLCKLFSESPEVSGLRLLDHKKKVVFEQAPSHKETTVHVNRELRHEGEKLVGYLDIYYTDTSREEHRKNTFILVILMVIGNIAGSFLFINILLKRYLSRPLDDLQKDMDLLAKGDFQQSDLVGQKAEIQNIIDTFNKLTISLLKRDEEVTTKTETLKTEILERKKAEEALRESEEKFKGLAENNFDMIFSTDKEGNITYVSPAAERIFGFKPHEMTGNHFMRYLAKSEVPRISQLFAEAIQGMELGTNSMEVLKKDGDNVYIELTASIISREDKVVGTQGIIRDVTEPRRLQDKLHRAQKMEAMGLMAGGVAHDLNNILSGIVSYPELLLLDLPEDSPLRKPIKTIQESGMRAADVVEDLLTIARGIASGKEVLNLNTLITEYLGSAEHQKLEKIHLLSTFKAELDPELLNITGSPSHVKKIMMNMVTNASEAIDGKGTVTVSTVNRYLDEPLKGYEDVRTGEYVMLTVLDDGSGIAPTDLERIFEPFYTKKVMGRSGTGLGLAVVWNSMQDHDGYINVKSSERGTAFELYFPVTREEVADKKDEVPLENYKGHGEKILVVDDEEKQREIAIGILTRLGYVAEAVSSGEEAIEYVKGHPVDLIVLDMVMPKGINGRETYEEIIKIHPGQKAIIASGYAKTKEVEMAQELGAGKYIKKPYTLAKVGLAVKEELEK
jgi:two-component system, cell cycle sensor histidine kinase and response regulator CckA